MNKLTNKEWAKVIKSDSLVDGLFNLINSKPEKKVIPATKNKTRSYVHVIKK